VPGSAEGHAPARTALAGNPSDGYGGAVLAVTIDGLGARARAALAPEPSVSPASPLVQATVARFAGPRPCSVQWSTTVPEGVGLGGSSAIAIAVIRALCALHERILSADQIAALALAIEREDLRIAGGRQDQVAEAYGGLTLMDFARDHHERLDPALLPPLVVAWRQDCAESSGIAHAALRARFDQGDPVVRESIRALTELAFAARRALLARDRDGFALAVDRTFELRARMMPLDPRHVAMVDRARSAGAAANYSGSGGAIVAACEDERHRARVLDALTSHGCTALTLAAPA
jgi:glucuronokinase